MSTNDSLSFRTQLNGYNKSDVNNFIEEQNIRFVNSEANYRKTIEEKQQQIKDLSTKLDEINSNGSENVFPAEEKAELEKQLSEKNDLINELEQKITDSNNAVNSVSELENKIISKDAEIEQLKNELADCRAKLEQKINDQVAEAKQIAEGDNNGAIYDKLSKQLGSMLIDAREVADNTIQEAQREAERIISEANTNATQLLSDVSEKKNAELDIIKRALKRLSSDISCEYLKYISDSRESFDRLLSENSAKQSQLLTELNELYVKTQSVIDVEMKTIDPNFQ